MYWKYKILFFLLLSTPALFAGIHVKKTDLEKEYVIVVYQRKHNWSFSKLAKFSVSQNGITLVDAKSNTTLVNFTAMGSDVGAIEGRLQHVNIANLLEGTPFSGTDYSFEERLSVVFQEHTFIFIESISQATKLTKTPPDQSTDSSELWEFDIGFFPAERNPNFKPYHASDPNESYFFTTAFLQSTHSNSTLALKHDIESGKKIVFSFADSVPLAYRNAIKEGLEYWNHAFNKEVIQVQEEPYPFNKKLLGLIPGTHVIEWIETEGDDLSRCAGNMSQAIPNYDPSTGQILSSRIRLLQCSLLPPTKDPVYATFLRNSFALYPRLLQTLYQVNFTAVHDKISDNEFDSFTKNRVRQMSAHEAGHVLGLRHNFMGSVVQTKPLSSYRQAFFKNLFGIQSEQSDVQLGSTVMDYYDVEDTFLIGQSIANKSAPFPYDQFAIEKLYINNSSRSHTEIPFCTDHDQTKVAACKQFDHGDPNSLDDIREGIEQIASSFLLWEISTSYYFFRSACEGRPDVRLNSAGDVGRPQFLSEVVESVIPSLHNFVDALKRSKNHPKELEVLTQRIEKAGGLKAILSFLDDQYYQHHVSKISEVIKLSKLKDVFSEPKCSAVLENAVGREDEIEQAIQEMLERAVRSSMTRLAYYEMQSFFDKHDEFYVPTFNDSYKPFNRLFADFYKERLQKIVSLKKPDSDEFLYSSGARKTAEDILQHTPFLANHQKKGHKLPNKEEL